MKILYQNIEAVYYWEFQCNGVSVYVVSSNKGAVEVKIGFAKEKSVMTEINSFTGKAELYKDRKHNENLIDVIENYLKGGNPSIDVPWDIKASPFIYNVYRSACTIPYGETKTYKDIAFMAGTPRGARAVWAGIKEKSPCHSYPVP